MNEMWLNVFILDSRRVFYPAPNPRCWMKITSHTSHLRFFGTILKKGLGCYNCSFAYLAFASASCLCHIFFASSCMLDHLFAICLNRSFFGTVSSSPRRLLSAFTKRLYAEGGGLLGSRSLFTLFVCLPLQGVHHKYTARDEHKSGCPTPSHMPASIAPHPPTPPHRCICKRLLAYWVRSRLTWHPYFGL